MRNVSVKRVSICIYGTMYVRQIYIWKNPPFISLVWSSLRLAPIIAERLSARLLILQSVFSVGGVWCHASLEEKH